jgi:hypothetical protein
MPSSSRITDEWSGICCCHTDPTCVSMGGWIITGAPKNFSANQKQGYITSTTVGYCGHTGEVVTGAEKVFSNNKNEARIGDKVTGCNIGELITGYKYHEIGS